MTGHFDAKDIGSWYHGEISRQEATDLLMEEKECGVFLVRNSNSIKGDLVLCVREDSKVSHYIINKIKQIDPEKVLFRIGDRNFPDLPSLLSFYRLHYLDTTPLIKPAPRRMEKVEAKFDFNGKDPDDLSFKKGEILRIISKREENWWIARNSLGQEGLIPVPYVKQINNSIQDSINCNNNARSITCHSPTSPGCELNKIKKIERKLPAKAIVRKARVPNAYDNTALKLELGDIILVTKMHMNGQWEGELNGKVGFFPFNHVDFIDVNENN